ncbi:MAG TPA: TonB-dependent receptor [Vicinamibacterales bacterium]|nr:TonB-dependent receptor [Vicinamibacterales bacterium]
MLLLLLGSPQSPSSDAQSLRGVVRDQTGAVLQGAGVELRDEADAVVRTTMTDAKGEYLIDRVPPGAYALNVQFEGFHPAAVRVRVAARRAPPSQTIVLELASQTQEVTVDAGGDVLAATASSNRDAVVLDTTDLKTLPIFDRDVVGTLSRFLDASALGTGGVTLVVDGMEARKVGVARSAIQQIKVNQDPYSGEFPRPGRGRIEVVTKAGSEKYSGSMDFTFRDAHINAREPFAESRPPEQRRIYEGVLGGPVGDGKHTSFLLTLDRSEENQQSIVFAQGPAGLIQANVPQPDRDLETSASVSHQKGDRHNLSLRFTSEVENTRNQGVGGTTLAEAGVDERGHEAQIIFGARSVLTSRLLHEFRLLLGHEGGSATSLHPGQSIVVLDAFTAGGAQADETTTENHFTLAESVTYAYGKHLFKGGFQIPDFSRRGFDDRSNREGTFTFSSLEDYALGRPLSFSQQQGDGSLVFLQKVFGAFFQDQISVNDRLSITPGIRYDWQNIFKDSNNFAPRVSAAYALNDKMAIRGGAGVFYDRAGDGALRDVLRSRDERLRRVILLNPSYPDPFGTGTAEDSVRSIVTLSPNIRMPYTTQYGFGVERILTKGTTVAMNYVGSRGVSLFRSRDVNAPPPPDHLARPNAGFGQIRQIESTGRQSAHSLQLIARGRLAPRVRGSVQYTIATARNDTSGINALPPNSYDLGSEWGRANFDQRHRFETLLQFKGGDWADFGVSLSLGSGRPYSLQTGRDDYHTGQTNARPAGVARNTLQGPGSALLDLRWSHEFGIGSGKGGDAPAWSIGIDAFNVINRVNYSGFVGTLSSPFFGRAIAAQPPRRIQLSAGFHF